MIKDLTKGEPLKLIFLFSIPLLIGNIFQQLYNIADIIIVGKLIGIEALASVGAVSPLFFLILFSIAFMNNGFAVVTGQRFGAEDYRGVRRSVTISTILSFVITTFVTLICLLLLDKILKAMNVPPNIMHYSYRYIQIFILGLVTTNFYNLLSSIIRALGDSKTPLYFLIFSTILNIFLAIIFIKYFGWGVPGTALAVVISQAFSALLCTIYVKVKFPILHLKKQDWYFDFFKSSEDRQFLWLHISIGIPMAVQSIVIGLGILIIQVVCNSFGSDVIAAFTAALRIEQIATLPLISFGIALSAFVAQNFGAKKTDRIKNGVLKCSLINVTISLFMAFVMRFFGSDIVKLFIGSENPEVIKIAHDYLCISTLAYLFFGQIGVFKNTLQGLGKAVIPLVASCLELFVRSYSAIYLASIFGYFGVFFASPIAWVVGAIVLAVGYFYHIKYDKNLKNF